MTGSMISSRANPLVKELRALKQKKARDQRGEFLVEGIQAVLQALDSGASVRMLVVAPDLLTSEVAQERVRDKQRAGMPVATVTGQVFQALAEREHPTGIAAVVRMTSQTLDDLNADTSALFVGLYQVSNPGNLGSILRTADAVRARGVILVGNVTDPYAPAALNASRGALFTVPLVRLETAQELMVWCREAGVRLVTTSDRGTQTLWEANLDPPLLVLFGNEGEGLPAEINRAGESVQIPMAGRVDSLNLAVAAGVILYEFSRRRLAGGDGLRTTNSSGESL